MVSNSVLKYLSNDIIYKISNSFNYNIIYIYIKKKDIIHKNIDDIVIPIMNIYDVDNLFNYYKVIIIKSNFYKKKCYYLLSELIIFIFNCKFKNTYEKDQ